MARIAKRDGDFELVANRPLFGSTWRVNATSPLPGERMTLYVTSGVVGHGYWRDLLVGDDAFDRRHFVYADNPALLPLVIGPDTREAIKEAGPEIALHVHRGRLETEQQTASFDDRDFAHHRAVHTAFAADHARAVERWERYAEAFEGRVLAKWPPVLALLRPIGTIVVSLSWRVPAGSSSAEWASAGESLATELLAEGAPGEPWRLDQGLATIGAHERIGDRHFEVHGEPTVSRAELGHAVTRAKIMSLGVGRHVTMRLAGMVAERARLEAAISLLGRIIAPEAPDSPYR
jgi:hypothetical protein